ncbi:MAG: glycoside hydrolase family 2 TIM barrel-domain containing protein [Bacteroidota bacterium]
MKQWWTICCLFVLIPLFGWTQTEGPIKVEMVQENGKWTLLRGGEPYFVKGVGGKTYLDQAAAYGANSLRTWSPDGAQEILDQAHERNMTVLMGLWVGQERQGFDYDDAKAVKAQLEGFRQVVREFKDHPALLMWGIGNENDLFYSNFKVWNAIEDLAAMIHEEDPNHPTMTVTAGLDVAEVQLIQERAPSIDIYGINTYAGLLGVGKELRQFGWERPYMITEWGPNGHWEVPKTTWGAPIEQSSTEKAASYRERYEKGIANDPEMCVGSYVFLWGHKQETTGTWYGVFLEDGTETEVMDVLEYVWTGDWPANRAPHIERFRINNKTVFESVTTRPGGICSIDLDVSDPDGDPLEYQWELLPESTDIKSGGDAESKPEAVRFKIIKQTQGNMQFRAPVKEGAYRMFVTVYDGNGNAGTVNLPFFVREGS